MARKRKKPKDPPQTTVTAEPGEPVELTRRFPPGTKIRPSSARPEPIRPPVVCDCGSEDVVEFSRRGAVRYYRCRTCVDPDTMDYTRFKRTSRA